MSSDKEIIHKEDKLRDWFTQGLSENDRIIDGFDIGWRTLLKKSFENILSQQNLEYDLVFHDSFTPNCQWSREIGLLAVEMYAQGNLQ